MHFCKLVLDELVGNSVPTNDTQSSTILSEFILILFATNNLMAHVLVFFNYYFVFDSVTLTRSRIEASIPRKHGPAIAGYESVSIQKHF